MVFNKRIYFLTTCITFLTFAVSAQDKPIGYWRSHLPYSSAIGLATDGNTLFTACREAFFTLNGIKFDLPHAYSKAEGMSDVGMQCVAYDSVTSTAVLVYSNGNIDLYKDDEATFYNIPDLKVKAISGNKSVNGIYVENGSAYLSTSVGILVIDLSAQHVDENFQFTMDTELISVNGFTGHGSYFYALTSIGIYRINKTNPQIQNFQVWQRIDTTTRITTITNWNNTLFLADQKKIYTLVSDTLKAIYSAPDSCLIRHIDPGVTGLLLCEYDLRSSRGVLKVMNSSFSIIDSNNRFGDIVQAVQLSDSAIWAADIYFGLRKIFDSTNVGIHNPTGPANRGCFDIFAHNKELWVAHGGYNEGLFAVPSFNGVSHFIKDNWQFYRRYDYIPLNTMDAFISVARNETDGTMYMGSFLNGLFVLSPDGSYQILNKNSIFDTSTAYFGDDYRQVFGLAFDQSDNLWVTTIFSQHNLYAKTRDGNWIKFAKPLNVNGGPITIDDYGQVWYAAVGGGGVVVYDPKGTIEDQTDDDVYRFTTGVGSGNLPSNRVYSIAKDRNNNIWVGTDNGIGIISNCSAPGPCDAQIPIVQYDQFAGYLFAGNNVRTIAVDGANRKWIGTDDGVWLLSPNADKIIYRFTTENSPLPSDIVRKITIDKITGDVYIGTDNGLVSYRSTAIEGAEVNKDVMIFPNPVPSTYQGMIAIKGVAANADVRITDISGQLVYRTTAHGGQAVWNGRDYTGHKPQSGVYFVFVSSSDGGQKYAGKIVFLR